MIYYNIIIFIIMILAQSVWPNNRRVESIRKVAPGPANTKHKAAPRSQQTALSLYQPTNHILMYKRDRPSLYQLHHP